MSKRSERQAGKTLLRCAPVRLMSAVAEGGQVDSRPVRFSPALLKQVTSAEPFDLLGDEAKHQLRVYTDATLRARRNAEADAELLRLS